MLRAVHSLVSENAEFLRKNTPKVKKNASAYNLYDLAFGLEKGEFDYTRLFVGSEGTLGIIVEAKLNLVPVPKKKVTALIYLERLNDAGDVTKKLVPLEPSAIEILDTNALDVVGRDKYDVPEYAEAMLLLEFNEGDLKKKVDNAIRILKGFKLSRDVQVAYEKDKQDVLWRARRAALPALSAYDPKKKPMPFIEDGIVPTEKVPDYIRFLGELFGSHGIKMGIYGHIGDGNTHIRPLMDIHDDGDFKLITELAKKVHSKIKELGGTMSGEHGDGRTTAQFLEEFLGKEMYGLMRNTKEIFDPDGIMNPDVIISSRNLTDEADIEKFSYDCGTCGKCNPYCPVFEVTGDEEKGPRGLFRLITSDGFIWHKSKDLLEDCVDCKLCGAICPAGTDPSELIRYERTRHPDPVAAKFDDECEGFACGFLKMLKPEMMREEPFNCGEVEKDGKIAYFYGCAANSMNESIPENAIPLLENLGYDVAVPEQLCCGAPFMQFGERGKAKEFARFNITSLARYEKVVTTCPHCASFLKEYPQLLEGCSELELSESLAEKVVDISELITTDKLKKKGQQKVAYQEPCYLRVEGNKKPLEVLTSTSNVVGVEAGCCGASLGYPIRKKEMSEEIRDARLTSLRNTDADVIVTSCPYCLIQLKGNGENIKHLVNFLNESDGKKK
jgi:Fe-S oxidoreductase